MSSPNGARPFRAGTLWCYAPRWRAEYQPSNDAENLAILWQHCLLHARCVLIGQTFVSRDFLLSPVGTAAEAHVLGCRHTEWSLEDILYGSFL